MAGPEKSILILKRAIHIQSSYSLTDVRKNREKLSGRSSPIETYPHRRGTVIAVKGEYAYTNGYCI